MSLLRPVAFVVVSGLSLMGALVACEEGEVGQAPPTTPVPKLDDPGCTVALDDPLRPDSGRSVAITYRALIDDAGAADADAGAPDPGADADAPDADLPDAESPDASSELDAGAPSDAAAPPVALQPDRVRTVACREGTSFDVAAAPTGNLRVVATGIRGQLVEFTETAQTRVALAALRPTFAQARLGTLPDGQPLVIGTPETEGQLVVWQGEVSAPVVPHGSVVLGTLVSNHDGSLLVPTGPDEALLRSSQGKLDFVGLFTTQFYGTSNVVGLGNDGQPFRVSTSSPAVVELGVRLVAIGGKSSVAGIAFTTLDAATPLPALALVRGGGGSEDTVERSFEVAVPAGADGYARIELLPRSEKCPVESGCSNVCEETSLQVEPGEMAMAWDGTRAFVVFVRRTVLRTRSYRMDQNSGIECHFLDCDPYCTSHVQHTTTAAEMVVATLDPRQRTVEERYVLPLEVSAGAVRSAQLLNGDDPRLQVSVRDGFLHVSRFGKYQGAYDATSTYRFRIAP